MASQGLAANMSTARYGSTSPLDGWVLGVLTY